MRACEYRRCERQVSAADQLTRFWTDILAFASALGCCASSVMTLLVFFPRDLEAEAGYRERTTRGSIATDAGGAGSEKRGPAPARPARPESTASFETPRLGNSWQDDSRGYSAYSASGYSGHIEPPHSATPLVRIVPSDIVEEDGAQFQLFHNPEFVHSTAALKQPPGMDTDEGDLGLAPEDMPHVLPDNMPNKHRTRPKQQWTQATQGPYQQRTVYPPHVGRGRFGGPSPSASAPDVRASRLTVHAMVRNYRSPIGTSPRSS